MPSSDSIWLVAAPQDSSPAEMHSELSGLVSDCSTVGAVAPPPFKTATLSQLLTLSESTAKQDSLFQATLSKIADTIKALDPEHYEQHLVMDDGRPIADYLLGAWHWNTAKFRVEGIPLPDLLESLTRDIGGIDAVQKKSTGDYNLVKGQLQTMMRKQSGNLATRDLAAVVEKEDVPTSIQESEYLDVVYVAVPKTLAKTWEDKYEQLTSMIVPRSSVKVASDDEYNLYTAVLFKRVKDDFAQKCREEKFIIRDFTYDEAQVAKQAEELTHLQSSEKELWNDLLRVSQTNLAEAVELTTHLRLIRAHVECLLRYGLPAAYFFAHIKPDPKQIKKLTTQLQTFFKPLCRGYSADKQQHRKGGQGNSGGGDEMLGEFAGVLEAEALDYVLFESPPLSESSS